MSNVLAAPKAFVSYAWDSESHQQWVVQLATRLRSNGVDVVLDVWDTRLGTDLGHFMESGITSADRVLVVCSDQYIAKCHEPRGGVGYEKKMLTSRLYADLQSTLVVPVIHNRTAEPLTPDFLGLTKYVDFRDSARYEASYQELLHDIHGKQMVAVPSLGPNPFDQVPAADVPRIVSNSAARYASPTLSGRVAFDYTNNNGNYLIGSGDMAFTVQFSESGDGSIHLYNDPANIDTIALAPNVTSFEAVGDAYAFDASSRSRTLQVGDAAILRNRNGYYAVLLAQKVVTRASAPDRQHNIVFDYMIQANRTPVFP